MSFIRSDDVKTRDGFESGYVPTQRDLKLSQIQDNHDLFIIDNNCLNNFLRMLNAIKGRDFSSKVLSSWIEVLYEELKFISDLSREGKLITLSDILDGEYKTVGIMKKIYRENNFQDINLDDESAIKLSKAVGYQLSLRQNLSKTIFDFDSSSKKRILELFLESESCIGKNGTKYVSDVDKKLYAAGIYFNQQDIDCAIISCDRDILVQRPLPNRVLLEKTRRELISENIIKIPLYHKAPPVYGAQERFPDSKIPLSYIKYENPKSEMFLHLS